MKNKRIKFVLCILISFVFLLSSTYIPRAAEEESESQVVQKLKKAVDERDEYKTPESTLNYLYVDENGNERKAQYDRYHDGSDTDLDYVIFRLFRSNYLYNVNKYSKPKSEKNKRAFSLYDEREINKNGNVKSICDRDREWGNGQTGSYLYHNCDLPTVWTGFGQNSAYSTSSPAIRNGERTTAYESGGLGVPAHIPGGTIPLNVKNSGYKYTGLELFGYDLYNTEYKGEWDLIFVNSDARLLSNFGVFDKVKLAGKTMLEGVTGAAKGLVKGFSFNPIKWGKNVWSYATGSGITTVLDTMDANVAATRAWGRSAFADTTYNGVHYLSNKIIAEKSQQAFVDYLQNNIEEVAKENDRFREWLEMLATQLPAFDRSKYPKYKNQDELDEYKIREAQAERAYQSCIKAKEKVCLRSYSNPPKPIEFTKEELKDFYKEEPEVKAIIEKSKKLGIKNPFDEEDIDIESIPDKLNENANNKFEKELEGSPMMKEIYEAAKSDFLGKHPEYNPVREISHWVCLDKEKPTTEELISAPHLYTDEFTGTINSACSITADQLRPTVKGGMLGSGDVDKEYIDDTRWQVYSRSDSRNLTSGSSALKGPTVLFTKITNTLMTFSFDEIMEKTGLDDIVIVFIETLRDGVYFPLISAAMAMTALYLFFQSKGQSGFLKNALILLMVFMISTILLVNPQKSINLIDKVPSTVDNYIMGILHKPTDEKVETDLCGIGGDNNYVRSVQCEIWNASIFKPWLIRQFGTSDLNNLNLSKAPTYKESLTGKPYFTFGGGSSTENWALYQLSLMKTGNITQRDESSHDGVLDKNMYRLVDWQYGPAGGANTNTAFATAWSGESRDHSFSFLGLVVSFLQLFVLGKFMVYKIQLSISMTFNLMLFPVVALGGMLPNGTERMRNYLLNLISIIMKRLFMTVFISMVLRFYTVGANMNLGMLAYFTYMIVVLLAFNHYWQDIVRFLASAGQPLDAGSSLGGKMLSGEYASYGELYDNVSNSSLVPKGVRQFMQTGKENVIRGTAGAIAGIAITAKYKDDIKDGNFTKSYKEIEKDEDGNMIVVEKLKKANAFDIIKDSSRSARIRSGRRMETKHRREGFGAFKNITRPLKGLDVEMANAITRGERTATNKASQEAIKELHSMGININQLDLIEDNKLQRMITKYARTKVQVDELKSVTYDSEEDKMKQTIAILEAEKKMTNLKFLLAKRMEKRQDFIMENKYEEMLIDLNKEMQISFEDKNTLDFMEYELNQYEEILNDLLRLQEVELMTTNEDDLKIKELDEITEEDLEKLSPEIKSKFEETIKQRQAKEQDNLDPDIDKEVDEEIELTDEDVISVLSENSRKASFSGIDNKYIEELKSLSDKHKEFKVRHSNETIKKLNEERRIAKNRANSFKDLTEIEKQKVVNDTYKEVIDYKKKIKSEEEELESVKYQEFMKDVSKSLQDSVDSSKSMKYKELEKIIKILSKDFYNVKGNTLQKRKSEIEREYIRRKKELEAKYEKKI